MFRRPAPGMMPASSARGQDPSTDMTTTRRPGRRKSRQVALPGERPLRVVGDEALRLRFEAALEAGDGAEAAQCIHDQWMRGAFPATVESALQRLWDRVATTVPEWMPMRHVDWLPIAYEVASRFRAQGRGRHNLYLVLLDYADSRAEPYGVYVGMSRYKPAERFDQHKAGIRAAGSVLKRGLEVLTGPVLHLQSIPRAEAERIEEQLAEALRGAGLFVKGGH